MYAKPSLGDKLTAVHKANGQNNMAAQAGVRYAGNYPVYLEDAHNISTTSDNSFWRSFA
jgi:hypothetical protein